MSWKYFFILFFTAFTFRLSGLAGSRDQFTSNEDPAPSLDEGGMGIFLANNQRNTNISKNVMKQMKTNFAGTRFHEILWLMCFTPLNWNTYRKCVQFLYILFLSLEKPSWKRSYCWFGRVLCSLLLGDTSNGGNRAPEQQPVISHLGRAAPPINSLCGWRPPASVPLSTFYEWQTEATNYRLFAVQVSDLHSVTDMFSFF